MPNCLERHFLCKEVNWDLPTQHFQKGFVWVSIKNIKKKKTKKKLYYRLSFRPYLQLRLTSCRPGNFCRCVSSRIQRPCFPRRRSVQCVCWRCSPRPSCPRQPTDPGTVAAFALQTFLEKKNRFVLKTWKPSVVTKSKMAYFVSKSQPISQVHWHWGKLKGLNKLSMHAWSRVENLWARLKFFLFATNSCRQTGQKLDASKFHS